MTEEQEQEEQEEHENKRIRPRERALGQKNNTWNIRRLVDELFVPATLHIILSDLLDKPLTLKNGPNPIV